jgi:hypothetical protein
MQWIGPNAKSYRTLGFPLETTVIGLSVCSTETPDEKHIVGFVVITAVIKKNFNIWVKIACSPLKANSCFGGTYGFHLQGRIN